MTPWFQHPAAAVVFVGLESKQIFGLRQLKRRVRRQVGQFDESVAAYVVQDVFRSAVAITGSGIAGDADMVMPQVVLLCVTYFLQSVGTLSDGLLRPCRLVRPCCCTCITNVAIFNWSSLGNRWKCFRNN